MLYQRIYGEMAEGSSSGNRQPAPEIFFHGVVCMKMKIGEWQLVYTMHA